MRAGNGCEAGKETLRADGVCERAEGNWRADDESESANDTVRELLCVRSAGSEV